MFGVDSTNDLLDETQNWVRDLRLLGVEPELLEIDIVYICVKCTDLGGSVFGNDVEISLHASEMALEKKLVFGSCSESDQMEEISGAEKRYSGEACSRVTCLPRVLSRRVGSGGAPRDEMSTVLEWMAPAHRGKGTVAIASFRV